jgi:subtilisin family serine protease
MRIHTIAQRGAIAAASAALATTALLGGNAGAASLEEPVSTPVPISAPEGVLMSYVVNASTPGATATDSVEKAVAASGGVVVQSWPQIGVVVAHSNHAAFRTDVVAKGGSAVESVGATRTATPVEGTPTDLNASWGRGVSADQRGTTMRQLPPEDPMVNSDPVAQDPREAEQWDMAMIKADQAHGLTDGNRSVLVGVLDSGIDHDHPDLAPNIDIPSSVNCTNAGRPDLSPTGWWPTTSDHGTHVAGTIAAARNGVGIVGVAPNARMASVKVVNNDGYIFPEYAVCGFMWSGLKHMDVTNNSYYVDPFMYWCEDQPDQYAAKEAVRRAVTWSTKQGVVHAAAAGNARYDLANKTTDATSPNDSTSVLRTINNRCEDIPAELDGVVTVSSMERYPAGTMESRLSGFSNRGLGKIDVAAPGSRILSTIVRDNGYGLKSGTSMASPHTAGVLALLKSAHPDWTPAELIAGLRAQADDKACGTTTAGAACVGPVEDNSYFGEGVIDALDAVS